MFSSKNVVLWNWNWHVSPHLMRIIGPMWRFIKNLLKEFRNRKCHLIQKYIPQLRRASFPYISQLTPKPLGDYLNFSLYNTNLTRR